jgi:hypothetical protein
MILSLTVAVDGDSRANWRFRKIRRARPNEIG